MLCLTTTFMLKLAACNDTRWPGTIIAIDCITFLHIIIKCT